MQSISLLFFYIAMALSIVYFDLFQSIDKGHERRPAVENLELVIEETPHTRTIKTKSSSAYFSSKQAFVSVKYVAEQFEKRTFHVNRILNFQLKERRKNQPVVYYRAHQQIALIISHQQMEEENDHFVV